MYDSTQAFTDLMDTRNLRYNYQGTSKSGDDILTVSFNTENTTGIKITFFFEEDCHNVAIRCFDLVKIPAERTEALYAVVNSQNRRFRFGKFCIDTDDNTIQMEMDAVFRDHDVGEICYELLMRGVNICDDAYPIFMKALWS